MIVEIVKQVLDVLEIPFKWAASRIIEIEEVKLEGKHIRGILVGGFYFSLPVGLFAIADILFYRYWFPELPHWIELITFIFPVFSFLFFTVYRSQKILKKVYDTNRRDLSQDLDIMKGNLNGLKDNDHMIRLMKSCCMMACNDSEPIKTILESLNPKNVEIVNKIKELSTETQKGLELISGLTKLPEKARDTLCNFLSVDMTRGDKKKKDWVPLFMTFAIQLQLVPWFKAQQTSKYTYIRDIEEIAPYYEFELIGEVFRQQLSDDLKEVLSLVNGKFLSVMYNDLYVWEDTSYPEANLRMLKEAKQKGTEIKRLFIYKEEWLNNPIFKRPLLFSAKWHLENEYPVRYIAFENKMKKIIDTNDQFLSSCLLNKTCILMYQDTLKDVPIRYKYKCDADEQMVIIYETYFQKYWEKGKSPEEFLSMTEEIIAEKPHQQIDHK